jgi:hypothetical protein
VSDFAVLELLTWIARKQLQLSAQLNTVIEGIATLMTDQDKLDADVAAENTAISAIEAEIAALKNQPPAASLDFTGLDAAVAKLQGDAPAPIAAPTDPSVTQPADPNTPAA